MAIPKFLVGDNTDQPENVYIIHTEYPRFVIDLDTDDVEWSCEDGTRTDIDYMCKTVELAIKCGAKTINIPDTVGYTAWEFYPTDMNVGTSGFVSGLSLALSKLTVGVCDPEAPGTNSANYYGYMDSAAWVDMSFNNGVGAGGYKGGTIFTITDGTDEMVVKGMKQAATYYERAWPVMPVTTDLDQQHPTASTTSTSYCHSKHHFWGKSFGQGAAATTFFPTLASNTIRSSNNYNYPNTSRTALKNINIKIYSCC